MPKIIYTRTDEAPLLATASWLPVVRAYIASAGIPVETADISLASRILARFPERLTPEQQVPDALAELGDLVARPDANIIKLPNISASIPQLKAAIAELQKAGYNLPDYPDEPADDDARATRARYDAVKGSAVNPVLRQGNSDRRAPAAVKAYARAHPHWMGAWSADSATRVATMGQGDFRENERSLTVDRAQTLRVVEVTDDGDEIVLHPGIALRAGEIFDGTVMHAGALDAFLRSAMETAAERGVLFSLHLKATMMKVSDPVIFGHAVRAFFPSVFAGFGARLGELGAAGDSGLGAVLAAADQLGEDVAAGVRAAVRADLAAGPDLAMVDPDRGITNLHVPSDVIVDASMAALIRNSGRMRAADGTERDTLAVIPDSSYAGIYQAAIDDCREHGAVDPATLGTVQNVGLMAGKAEEYGSHDKTFVVPADGRVQVRDETGRVLFEHDVAAGDIWRGCQAQDAAIRDWVALAVRRGRATGDPVIFWLDATRAHDAQVIAKVRDTLAGLDTDGLDVRILDPVSATKESLRRARAGQDTIAVTGNVLRDYITDLFPILEVGTSAKMLSIVPLLAGGGLFETGAGGSAPRHVQQFVAENHLRWDSLGEFFALAESLRHEEEAHGNIRAGVLARALDAATGEFLEADHSPSRRVGEPDDRASHYWLAREWAEALAAQTEDAELAERFAPLAARLEADETAILDELARVQGHPVDLGGYYLPDPARVEAAMRPSAAFVRDIDEFAGVSEQADGK